jgi:hypothetical protein
VIVVLDRNPPLPSMAVRAWTHIQRDRDGRLRATVRIGEPNRAAELIAHEFEHIVEQLDGIDLRSKASLEATGVRQCHCADVNAFETMRAVHVGRRVAREVGERRR